MNMVEGKLDSEDLARLQLMDARREAQRRAPTVFSAEEHVQCELSWYRLCGELVERYHIDDAREWHISQYTGTIYYD